MNRENPVLRPYDGLQPLEDLVNRLKLKVRAFEEETINAGERAEVSAVDLRIVGLRLMADWTEEDVTAAAKEVGLPKIGRAHV